MAVRSSSPLSFFFSEVFRVEANSIWIQQQKLFQPHPALAVQCCFNPIAEEALLDWASGRDREGLGRHYLEVALRAPPTPCSPLAWNVVWNPPNFVGTICASNSYVASIQQGAHVHSRWARRGPPPPSHYSAFYRSYPLFTWQPLCLLLLLMVINLR